MNAKYSVVVIGMGKRGKHHASAFAANPSFEVVGICDIDTDRLAEAAAMLPGDLQSSTDASALVSSVKPDVLCFCTMPHLRLPFIQMAAENNVRLVAFEKPLADSSAAAIEIKKVIEDSGMKAVVSHQHRYGVHYSKVKEIVAGGAFATHRPTHR